MEELDLISNRIRVFQRVIVKAVEGNVEEEAEETLLGMRQVATLCEFDVRLKWHAPDEMMDAIVLV
ncbi:hypothetical protein Pyn_21126 [Prunus yedoensis var. nudiflora]|uniref:Uncharacterized protein n=1 Tax=Prunus yedoensis var. nudiflora TaxID=2094558 RepID=A0A314XM04_PRUYE|nr:hypothetical protein Pyn_21126 [Prunus yedoensis var. nudiflora]